MLIDQLRRRRMRVLLQVGALVVVAVSVLTPVAGFGPIATAFVHLLVGMLLLVTVKGLLVVAVATRTMQPERPVARPDLERPELDPREVRELHGLLNRFFDDDPSVNGKVERLARMVEPMVASDASRGQELTALRERLERLEHFGSP